MIFMDSHEAAEVQKLLEQSVPVNRQDINQHDMADYLWYDVRGKVRQFENKSWTELLWGMDSCEEQLRRQRTAWGDTNLVVRGMIVPTQEGVATYRVMSDGGVRRQRTFKDNYAKICGWVYSLQRKGVEVYQVPNNEALAQFLVTAYKNDQHEGHRTLERYYVERSSLWTPNHHVASLMGLRGPGGRELGIGEVRATALVKKFKTTWNVLSADARDLATVHGVGQVTAQRLLESIGR